MPDKVSSKECFESQLSLAKDLMSVTEPLKNIGSSFFSYARVYDDGKLLYLCDDPEWVKKKFHHDLFAKNVFIFDERSLSAKKTTYTIFSGQPEPSIKIHNFLKEHKIWNSFSLHKRFDSYFETFHFGGSTDSSEGINFYVNNTEILERFILYFRTRAEEVIQKSLSLTVPDMVKVKVSGREKEQMLANEIMSKIDLNFYTMVMPNGARFFITRAELKCLKELSEGKRQKEIAATLSISPRTVEAHLRNIKHKTGAYCSSKLVDLYRLNFST